MRSAGLVSTLKGMLPLVVALAAWQLLAGGSPALPPPSAWWAPVALLAKNGALTPALIATLTALIISLAAASVAGFVLGLLVGTLPALRQWLSPFLEFFRAIPPPVFIPIVVLMLGYTNTMKILVISFAAFWPVLLNTMAGVGQISGLTFDVAVSFRLSWLETLFKIVIPATIPSFLLGLRVALPHTIILTLVVEIFTDATGLGGLMIDAQRNFNAAAVLGLLVVVGFLGFCLSVLLNAAERLILKRWPTRAT